jgi:hypothetical protein
MYMYLFIFVHGCFLYLHAALRKPECLRVFIYFVHGCFLYLHAALREPKCDCVGSFLYIRYVEGALLFLTLCNEIHTRECIYTYT